MRKLPAGLGLPQLFVQVLSLANLPLKREILAHPLGTGGGQLRGMRGIAEQACNGSGECGDVSGWNRETGLAVHNDFRRAVHGGGDH